MASLLLHAWVIDKCGNEYYLHYSHWIYLKQIYTHYSDICLLSPINQNENAEKDGLLPISKIGQFTIYALPSSFSYLSGVPHFFDYLKAYRKLRNYDAVYVRYPRQFGWLSKFFFRKKKRIIHFVGDPIEVTQKNPNFSFLKKVFLISFFIPEHTMYLWACKGAKVFSNGNRISEKLKRFGIVANTIVSSTLIAEDFHYEQGKNICLDNLRLLYVGYLRKWKGIEIVVRAFSIINKRYPNATLTIVGGGEPGEEFEAELRGLVSNLNLAEKVRFVGHVEDRQTLNHFLRTHDVFCLASISEGSPRVVLEAMANGINVICTRVGSVPYMFTDEKELLFVDFNDPQQIQEKVLQLGSDHAFAEKLRFNAYQKVKMYTNENFIKTIFQ